MRILKSKAALFLLVLSLPSTVTALETNMSVQLTDGSAHFTIVNADLENITLTKKMIMNPMIYPLAEARASLFCDHVKNFIIIPMPDSIVLEFDCTLGMQKRDIWESVWEIEKRDLRDEINPLFLTIKLPEGFELKYAEPEPDEISGSDLTWRNADFMPYVVYKKESLTFPVAFTGFLVAVFAILLYRRLKK